MARSCSPNIRTAKLAKNVDVAEFAVHTLGPKLTDNEPLLTFERGKCTRHALRRSTEPASDIGGEEWAVSPAVSAD